MLRRGRDVQSDRAQTATVRTMSHWAADARNPQSITPTRRLRSRSDYLAGVLRAEQTSVFWEIALGLCIQNA
jgi:hypothetical protein